MSLHEMMPVIPADAFDGLQDFFDWLKKILSATANEKVSLDTDSTKNPRSNQTTEETKLASASDPLEGIPDGLREQLKEDIASFEAHDAVQRFNDIYFGVACNDGGLHTPYYSTHVSAVSHDYHYGTVTFFFELSVFCGSCSLSPLTFLGYSRTYKFMIV